MQSVTTKVDYALPDTHGERSGVPPAPSRAAPLYDLDPGDVVDGFRIERVLARCGMGSVFKAHAYATGATVVLKVPHLRFECDVVFYSRFQREEQIGLRLCHPGIARVLPAADKSRPYLVIEYVEGRSLCHALASEGRIAPERAKAIGRQICEAVAYMHGQGVVHRDLKPENVVLDASGMPRIVDFGIALDYRDRRLTWGRLSNRLGTPEYMAPEQIRGRRGDARVDIYALGAVLYELLSGTTPYAGGSVGVLLKAKLRDDPRPLSDAAPGVDPALAAVVMRALARDPSARFSSAVDMLSALTDPSRLATLEATRIPRLSPSTIRMALLYVALLGMAWLLTRV
jgi:serine/threonine protein kinase